MMKFILLCLAITFSASLYANNDDYRRAVIARAKETWKLPVKQPGGLTLNDMFYAKEIDAPILTYLGGVPEKDIVKANGTAYWASAEGQRMKKLGFKDWIYSYGSFNKATGDVTEHGVFSCAERKWYRDGEHFLTVHDLN